MAIVSTDYYIDQANLFIASVASNTDSYYLYAAKPTEWVGNTIPANNSLQETELSLYNDLLFGKNITSAEINHLIPRTNWVANTVYSAYDASNASFIDSNFVVVTDQYNVFKCIFNNNGANSVVKPTLTSVTGTSETSDGYIWKYMFTVDPLANTKFTSDQYIPVTENEGVASNAVPGTIDAIKVISGGSGYNVSEDGTIASVIDRFTIRLPNTASNIDNWYANSSIYLRSGFGSGQVREIVASSGSAKTITISTLEPLSIYSRFDLSNTVILGSGDLSAGMTIEQPVTYITYLQSAGFFNIGDSVVQTNTGSSGTIFSVNSTSVGLFKTEGTSAFVPTFPIRSLSDGGTLAAGNVSISNSGILARIVVANNGSGYVSNTQATITITGLPGSSGAVANAVSNTTGRMSSFVLTTPGTGYFFEPTVAVSAPANTTFNANTDVTGGTPATGANGTITLSTASTFQANDLVTYRVSSGNTKISELTANSTYWIQFANSTVIALSATKGGPRLSLTKGLTQNGHSIQGQTASIRILPDTLLVTNAASLSGTTLTSNYANGDFIRLGSDANNNIRQIETVNSSAIVVTYPFMNLLSNTTHFKVSTALVPITTNTVVANGVISNSNLGSTNLVIANVSTNGAYFTTGEILEMVDAANTSAGTNGIVAFSNSTNIFVSNVSGTWSAGFRARGLSSLLQANVVTVAANPNITVVNPEGSFILGQSVFFKSGAANTGRAKLVNFTTLTSNITDYSIAPTVKIVGDGTNCFAFAVVNTAPGSSNSISSIRVFNPGTGYTNATVQIYANSSYGTGASATPVISPISGHGANAHKELGARYVGISAKFDTANNENNYFPSNVTFRKFGILKNPLFDDVRISLTDISRVRLSLTGTLTSNPNVAITSWVSGEMVLQSSSNAAGVVVNGNSTVVELQSVKGTFTNNPIFGYFSNTSATVSNANVLQFTTGPVFQASSNAYITAVVSTANLNLSNVQGSFSSNTILYNTSNAYAKVETIFTANATKDQTATFGSKFNQTARLTLASSVGRFTNGEIVTQPITGARGRVISTNNHIDLSISNLVGSFAVGERVVANSTNANGVVLFANSSYLKLTDCSPSLAFNQNASINNGTGATANVSQSFSVLVLADVTTTNTKFSAVNAYTITGNTSGAFGSCDNWRLISYPDLVRDTGTVLWYESVEPVVKSINTSEEVKLVIKF